MGAEKDVFCKMGTGCPPESAGCDTLGTPSVNSSIRTGPSLATRSAHAGPSTNNSIATAASVTVGGTSVGFVSVGTHDIASCVSCDEVGHRRIIHCCVPKWNPKVVTSFGTAHRIATIT